MNKKAFDTPGKKLTYSENRLTLCTHTADIPVLAA
jgi:hypothetical protein